MPVKPGGDDGAPRRIMPAVFTIRVGHTAGDSSIPGEVGPELAERAAQTDGRRLIPPGIGAAIQVVKAPGVGMGDDIIGRKKDMPGIPVHHLAHHLPRAGQRRLVVSQRSFVADRSGKDIERDPAVRGGQDGHDFGYFINVFPCKGVNENGAGIAAVVCDLTVQKIFGFTDSRTGFIIAPDGDMDPVADGGIDAANPVRGDAPQGHLGKTDRKKFGNQGGFGSGQDHIGDAARLFTRA